MGRQFQQVQDSQVFVAPELVIFDRQQFEASTMFDLALQREILGLFFAQLNQVITRLSQGPLTAEESRFISHTLRGAAAAMGALEVKKLATDWDRRLVDQNGLSAQILEAMIKFKQSVTRYLPVVELQ